MASSVLIYTDSSSIYVWNNDTEVGPASYVISGESVHEYIDDFRNVLGIRVAETIELCWSELLAYIIPPVNDTMTSFALSEDHEQPTYGPLGSYEMPPIDTLAKAAYLSPEFLTSFPDMYTAIEGRFPRNDSEIAVAYWLAARFKANPGTRVNYTRGSPPISSNVTIVGIFRQPVTNNSLELHYIKADVIVTAGLLGNRNYESYVYADIDRSHISPQNPSGSLTYLADLDEELRRVDPEFRVTKQWTIFYVDDLLAQGINTYMAWLNHARISQLQRTSGFIFLGLLVSGVGVDFDVKTKRTEVELLRARGASSIRIISTQYHDIAVLTIFAIPLGIVGGCAISRLGLVCSNFFSFDFSKLFSLPLLLSTETIIITTFFTFLAPLLIVISQNTTERIKSSSFVTGSRLAKYSGKMHNVRWEILVLIASSILLGSIIQQGGLVSQTPDFKIVLEVIPIVIALSLTSLVIKGINVLTKFLSVIINRIFRHTPFFIGVRRIGRNTRMAGPTMVILVLTISLSWSAIVTSSTIPSTTEGHTRFAIGGDLAFKLNSKDTSKWDEFARNVTNHEFVQSATQVIVRTLYITSSLSSGTDFVSIKPSEFLEVGYDSAGKPLKQSSIGSLLDVLDANPSGIVVTGDLSTKYDLQIGDTLRACTVNNTEFVPHPFTIVGITGSLPDSMVTESGYNFLSGDKIGLGRIWANSEYVEPLLSGESIARSLLCVRMSDISRSDELIESIIESGGLNVIDEYGIATVVSEVDRIINDQMFVIERSIDTMLVLLSWFSVIAIFYIYSTESKNESQKQNTILKTLGTDNSTLKIINTAEILGLLLVAFIVLLVVSPVFITTSLMVYLIDYGVRLFQFPLPIIIETPWLFLISFMATIIVAVVFLSFATKNPESRVDLLVGSFRNTPLESVERGEV